MEEMLRWRSDEPGRAVVAAFRRSEGLTEAIFLTLACVAPFDHIASILMILMIGLFDRFH